jgi:hypothetical protein
MIETITAYYGQQLDKVRDAKENNRSEWGRKWLSDLERQLKRHMDRKLVDINSNRSYHMDTRTLEER